MAARNQDFHDYVMHEVFSGVAGITSRPMFGGYGIYKDGVFFALISGGSLYFKADEETKGEFERRSSQPFRYSARGRGEVTLSYWEVPADILESRGELRGWIDRAVRAQLKSGR